MLVLTVVSTSQLTFKLCSVLSDTGSLSTGDSGLFLHAVDGRDSGGLGLEPDSRLWHSIQGPKSLIR